MKKAYTLQPDQIERFLPDTIGFAFATDMITVEGKKVDYMVREQTDKEGDSGWIFYGGGETGAYMDNPDNTSVLHLNTIANFDPEILGFLTYPAGTEIERNAKGRLQLLNPDVPQPDMRFMNPVDKGTVQITKNWRFDVSSRMLRRIENNNLIIWKPGFTIWLTTYAVQDSDIENRVRHIEQTASPDKLKFQSVVENKLTKVRYRLIDDTDGKPQPSVYLFGLNEHQEINIAIYFDGPEYNSEIESLWNTLAASQ